MYRKDKIRIIAGAFGLAGFFVLTWIVTSGYAAGFDDAVRGFFYGIRSDALTPVVRIITYMGNWQTIVGLCIVLLAVKPLRIKYGVPLSAGALAVTAVNKGIKHIVGRPRPDDIVHLVNEGGFSFSSGHAATSMFFYGILIYLVRVNIENKKKADFITVLLALPMLLIGPSRIYLGVHYPTDVLAGWCLGIVMIAVVSAAVEKIGPKRGHENER
ncbi:MAG: phosphatase PAP2 family protein [Anaerovoracaceae bacterium]